MTLEELIGAVRDILDDHVVPTLVSDDVLVGHLNDAVSEACIRTRVIQDSTSKVCAVAVKAGVATYRVDPCVFAIRRARLDGQCDPMDLRDVSQLDCEYAGWDDPTIATRNTPRAACFDYGTGNVTFVPTPLADGTVRLLVWRAPTENERLDAADASGEPSIPQHMHRELKHWAAAMVYTGTDAELRDPAKAGEQLGLFEAAYGEKPTLHDIRLWSTNKRRRVRASFD